MFGWKIVRARPSTPAEDKLEQIANILFPPLLNKTSSAGDKYQVDFSVDSNLEAALLDLEDGNNDKTCQLTIRTVANKLFQVRNMLEAYAQIDPEAKFLVVDYTEEVSNIKEREVGVV